MKTSLPLSALLAGAATLAPTPPAALAQSSTFAPGQDLAWTANAGWIDFTTDRPGSGDGVRVQDRCLAGLAWSPNFGWIHFGDGSPANGVSYANLSHADHGVNHDGAGNLSGLAWSANTGWINFGWAGATNTHRPRFDLASGQFSGLAWSPNLGWINLETGLLRTRSISIVDADNDGIADSWELTWVPSLTTLNGTGDHDGDGILDKEEYLADTSPVTPNAPFRISQISKIPGANAIELQWPSRPTRVYDLEGRPDVSDTRWLLLGTVPGAAGTNTTQAIEAGPAQAFFRIGVKLPLQPAGN